MCYSVILHFRDAGQPVSIACRGKPLVGYRSRHGNSGLGYDISESIVFRQKKAIDRFDERARKAAHVLSNLSACLAILILGPQTTSYLVLLALFVGIPVMHLTVMGIKFPGLRDGSRK